MTREEAIKRLEVVRTNALIQKANGASEYWQEEIDGTIKAIDMAIEALSADTVSREMYDKRTQADEKIIDSYRQEFQKALHDVIKSQDDVIKKPKTVRYKLHKPIEYVSIEFDEEETITHIDHYTAYGERREP